MDQPEGQNYDVELRRIVRQSTNDCPLADPFVTQGYRDGDPHHYYRLTTSTRHYATIRRASGQEREFTIAPSCHSGSLSSNPRIFSKRACCSGLSALAT